MRAHTISTVLISALLLAFAGSQSLAVTHYVDINSTTPVSPYTNWASSRSLPSTEVAAPVGSRAPGR